MRKVRSEGSPLLVREMDGFSPDEAKARAERLAGLHVSFGGLWLNETTELLPDLSHRSVSPITPNIG